uniref:Ribosome biogenesis protein slx9-like n=1 Tax=Leersia perrieri TaxID=77586 RepID=A0A0D9XY72_9ORYZ
MVLATGSSKKQELKSKQKLEKKLSFYTKVKDAVTSLNATKTISKKTKLRNRKKKLKAYDLSALSEFLPETDASKQHTETKLNCKSKQALVQREAAQLNAVLTNPQFQLDPFAAIHQHLLSTQPPSVRKESDSINHEKNPKDKKRKKNKKKKNNTSSTSESMDI